MNCEGQQWIGVHQSGLEVGETEWKLSGVKSVFRGSYPQGKPRPGAWGSPEN
jgi:hypothetical protein